jgi:predicted deacylase
MILITAGMDGDEYAGIEAAIRARVRYGDLLRRREVAIVPVVNEPGFWNETSINPQDSKYPKFAGLGKRDGSATQQMVYRLVETYARHATLWLDLHGGARTETIAPFLWAWETGVDRIDDFVTTFISVHSPRYGIFEHQKFPKGKAAELAAMGCAYILAEAGGSGPRREEDIHQHEAWIDAGIAASGYGGPMRPARFPSGHVAGRPAPTVYTSVAFARCKRPGLWFPADTAIRVVQKGESLGVVRSLDGKRSDEIRAPQAGQILWIKDGLRALPTDELVAIGHTK